MILLLICIMTGLGCYALHLWDRINALRDDIETIENRLDDLARGRGSDPR